MLRLQSATVICRTVVMAAYTTGSMVVTTIPTGAASLARPFVSGIKGASLATEI